MSERVFRVTSEGDMEEAVKLFTALALSRKKKKNLSLWFATETFADIFLRAAYMEYSMRNIPAQPNMDINIYIKGDSDDLEDEQES